MTAPVLRRRFIDVGARQIHIRTNEAAGLPLVMLHASPGSAVQLIPLAEALAAGRRVVAVDTPGNGDSDPLALAAPEIEDYADALAATLDRMAVTEADIYGTHTGANIALALAQRHPARVRNLVIDGLGVYTDEQRARYLADYAPAIVPQDYGEHLLWAWHFCRDQYLFFPWFQRDDAHRRGGPVPDAATIHRWAVELIKGLSTYHLAYRAAFRFDKRAALSAIGHRCLICANPLDPLHAMLADISATHPSLTVATRADDPVEAARAIGSWLDAGQL